MKRAPLSSLLLSILVISLFAPFCADGGRGVLCGKAFAGVLHKGPERRDAPDSVDEMSGAEERVLYGRKIAARILGMYGLVEDADMTQYVNLVGRLCAANAVRHDLTYHFAIIDSEREIAFAAPGGYVFVTLGMLRSLRSEAELAGVLSHEIAHLDGLHLMKEIEKRFGMGELVALNRGLPDLVGRRALPDAWFEKAQKIADFGLTLLLDHTFSGEDELKADSGAVATLSRAGYPADGLISHFKRLGER